MADTPGQSEQPEAVWEAWAREVLDASEHDSDLGVQVARDARRVVAGELAEDEYRRRHHDAYLEEFGVDDRPDVEGVAPRRDAGDDGVLGTPSVVSRRKALAVIGGGAAAMLFAGELLRHRVYGAEVTGDVGAAAGATPVQFGMVIDLERCDGCLLCVLACKQEHTLSDGTLWPYVFAYQEPEEDVTRFLFRLCQHCSRAPCVMVCPTAARHRRLADGLILTDYDTCIGCRYCQVACPYGVNYFQWGDPKTYGGGFEGDPRDARGRAVDGDPPRGVMGKCTFCPQRQDDPEWRGTTACADACPMGALRFGDLNDPESDPRRYLAQRRKENGGTLPTFRLLEDMGTNPNVIYIGQPPSSRAEVVEGPYSYEERGLLEDRRAVLEGPKPWFRRATREV